MTADAGTDPCRAFLAGYPADLLDQVRARLADGSLGADLARRYPDAHTIRTDGALYDHASSLKARHLRNAPALNKVAYDGRLQIDQRALGTLTAASRVQGGRLSAKRELRVAACFKQAALFYPHIFRFHATSAASLQLTIARLVTQFYHY